MQGVSNHVSDPKSSTVCTTAFKNIPETLGLSTSRTRILVLRYQLFQNFLRFPTTAGQSSSAAVKTRSIYL